jgi:hypothetical protein
MKTLSDFRHEFAEALGTTAGSWKNSQIELWRWKNAQIETSALGSLPDAYVVVDDSSVLKVSPSVSPGFQISPPATLEDCGLLIVAAMIRGDRASLAPRVMHRWHSTLAPFGVSPPVIDDVRYLHELVVTLLMSPEEAAKLDHIEMTREFTATLFAWKEGEPSVFEARDVNDIAKRELIMGRGDLLTVSMLSGRRMHEMAQWLARARDGPELAPRRTREKASPELEV